MLYNAVKLIYEVNDLTLNLMDTNKVNSNDTNTKLSELERKMVVLMQYNQTAELKNAILLNLTSIKEQLCNYSCPKAKVIVAEVQKLIEEVIKANQIDPSFKIENLPFFADFCNLKILEQEYQNNIINKENSINKVNSASIKTVSSGSQRSKKEIVDSILKQKIESGEVKVVKKFALNEHGTYTMVSNVKEIKELIREEVIQEWKKNFIPQKSKETSEKS